MNPGTATIREIRTNFRSVKRKVEQFGEIVITDHGEPAFALRALPRVPKKKGVAPDYMARLRRQRREPIPVDAMRALLDEARGDR